MGTYQRMLDESISSNRVTNTILISLVRVNHIGKSIISNILETLIIKVSGTKTTPITIMPDGSKPKPTLNQSKITKSSTSRNTKDNTTLILGGSTGLTYKGYRSRDVSIGNTL